MLLGKYYLVDLAFLQYAIMTGLVLLFAFFFLSRNKSVFVQFFGLALVVCFGCFGALLFQLKTEVRPEDHYTKIMYSEVESQLLELRLEAPLQANAYNQRFYGELSAINGRQVTGRVLIQSPRESSISFQAGDVLTVFTRLNLPNRPRNPDDFDYAKYLASIDVYAQVSITQDQILANRYDEQRLGFFERQRSKIQALINNSGLSSESSAMIEALLLGQKQNLDPEITRSFRDAGVIHILALSGLHVGIILLILRFFTMPLRRIRYGSIIQTVFLIAALIGFAFLTGASPSIRRAVTMFSFVAIGLGFNRKTSTFHALAVSAFVLLVHDPRLLFQVGFQLSYTAVLSIVLIQPLLANLWPVTQRYTRKPLQWVRNYLWNVLTVTLAAQIGIAPISIYYFHQFPTLFLIGNMILLPFLPLILGLMILLVVLLIIGVGQLIDYCVKVLDPILHFFIESVNWVSNYQNSVIRDIGMDWFELILIYLFVLSLVLFLSPYIKRSKREFEFKRPPAYLLHFSLIAIIGLTSFRIYKNLDSDEADFFVLHKYRSSLVSVLQDNQALVFNSYYNKAKTDSIVRSSVRNISVLRSKSVNHQALPNLVTFQNLHLQVIDSTGVYAKIGSTPIVLLSHSPRINLERMLDSLKPQAVISDGSNYRSFVERCQQTCNRRDVPFYNTYEDGAIDLLKFKPQTE